MLKKRVLNKCNQMMDQFPQWRSILETVDVNQVCFPRQYGAFTVGSYKVHVDDFDFDDKRMDVYIQDEKDEIIAEATMFDNGQVEFYFPHEPQADMTHVLDFMYFFRVAVARSQKRVRFCEVSFIDFEE